MEEEKATCNNHVHNIDQSSRAYGLLLAAQSLAYQRSTINRVGWANPDVQGEHISLCPYPSELRSRSHPSMKWDVRSKELTLVMSTGIPICAPVSEGHQWFIIDAHWFRHWIEFVSSERRMSAPGPIDNLWMLNPVTDKPYTLLTEDTDDVRGDFRRVTPQVCFSIIDRYNTLIGVIFDDNIKIVSYLVK